MKKTVFCMIGLALAVGEPTLACPAVTVCVFADFPSDFGLPGIGFKPSFVLSLSVLRALLARRMFWLEAKFFHHAIRSPEKERTKAEEGN